MECTKCNYSVQDVSRETISYMARLIVSRETFCLRLCAPDQYHAATRLWDGDWSVPGEFLAPSQADRLICAQPQYHSATRCYHTASPPQEGRIVPQCSSAYDIKRGAFGLKFIVSLASNIYACKA